MRNLNINSNDLEVHFIMYFKNWYAQNDFVNDLKTIVSQWSYMEIEHITDEHLFHFASMVYEKYVKNKQCFGDMIIGAFKHSTFSTKRFDGEKTELSYIDFVKYLGSLITHKIMVEDIKNWPTPNSDLLPLNGPETLQRWQKLNS